MGWQPLGPQVEGVYLHTPLSRFAFGVWTFRYRRLLVDAGPAWALPGLPRPEAEALLLTHAHEDHAGGAAGLGLPVYAGPLTQAILSAPPQLPLYRLLVWGPLRPVEAQSAEQVGPLEALPTPGHAPDHMVWWDPKEGVVFAGDLFLGVRANLAPPGFSFKDLLRSLEAVMALKPKALYCAHAGRVEDPLEALRAKRAFLLEVQSEALRLKAKGLTLTAIRNRLFGGESPVGLFSRGEMSRLNFVRALIVEA
ncbi:Zn-dependent hydrolase, glyoxylase [Thermus oshimai JL-2]|uniref:Zn-dependent hydrolase, glyoxylase n=1 Tax=Thermus oshimai JL-2 TaxID=751945 RepID=K7QUI7_THEOS|nr:MBL fold metallo-hydrolase [Thermus oshimai]AFV75931.1 Zn-dependent hydrolase, glyoxylase [Thermus oshimai JL-2]